MISRPVSKQQGRDLITESLEECLWIRSRQSNALTGKAHQVDSLVPV